MAYCTTTQLASAFKGLTLSSSTKVTDSEASDWIDEESAYMDGYIARRYTTPVTETNSLLILRKICLGLVAHRLRNALSIKSGDTAITQSAGVISKEDAQSMLERIAEGDLLLTDGTDASSEQGVKGYANVESLEFEINTTADNW